MSAEVCGEVRVDKGFYEGNGLKSVRWRSIDEVATRCFVKVFDDEDAYIAYTVFQGRNICYVHRDPAEACLGALTLMARKQLGDEADF